MARPTSTFSDFVLSVTNQVYVRKVVDNILNGNFGEISFKLTTLAGRRPSYSAY